MDELIDIWDANGNPTGKSCLKSEAHRLGLFHPVVHVWCYSKLGKILLQQRSKSKSINPLKWDVSVAGHIGAGENPVLGAYREAQEEIGITINTNGLQKIGVFKAERKYSESLIDNEFVHTFLYALDESTVLNKQQSEVEALEWLSLQQFEESVLQNDPRFVPNSKERYKQVLIAIQGLL